MTGSMSDPATDPASRAGTPPDLTIAITAHREGRLAVASLRSFGRALVAAQEAGLSVEPLLVLDSPDDLTRRLFERAAEGDYGIAGGARLIALEVRDQGRARNEAVAQARGRRIGFLDGDDLWSRDWLVRAMAWLDTAGPGVIAHPAYNYFFEGQATIYRQIDQDSEEFSLDFLRVANYWDALCLCETSVLREHPFPDRDMANGWAYEDWAWNCLTVAAGLRHKIVPDTVLFKRRQAVSQTIRASTGKAMMRPTPLSDYAFRLPAAG
ncbi:glycosyltransferase family 2 protein [Pseudoroseicyclus aestuarii]|uniref:Glycosyltransferase involved in cell wall biosynthesis n=1 Tax=Pseudoroseicyclus aestuarii TaxID=1795041 RepID=A0A318SN96_9RHOB|nr:glycosyltransferase family 2 protein [Pseudoroseicyclus aestuarii]PYE82166.1 glycosyltransferase involved in cell wall biosynthesis [Pseudoroseicyclus aestuarii]